MPRHALDGLRVLDLSRVLAGPFCCMMLGDHGADVIKVESPRGDETRTWGPPFVDGQSAYYLNINRNKRGIVLDLAKPDAQAVLRRLAMTSDVLVENFLRRDTLDAWGLGYDTLRTLNPRLIYATISGFGRDGPYANVAGYDAAVQALAGFMSVNGDPSSGPLKAAIAISDLATGLYASQAILLALHDRFTTGVGQRVEVSLMESMLSLLHPHTSSYLNANVVPGLQGNSAAMISPYDLLQASDRPIYLPGGNDGQVRRLFRIIGRPELIDDPRFRTNPDRVRHRAELLDILQAELCKRPAAEWCRVLWDAGVPVGPVNTIDEVFSDPQVVARQVVVETPHAGLSSGAVRTIKSPAILHDTPAEVRRPPPMLGEHTREVLAELGYSDESLQGLLDSGDAGA